MVRFSRIEGTINRVLSGFQDHHFIIKSSFDFYADTFFQRMFSAWDTVGHIINIFCELGFEIRKVTFAKAVQHIGSDRQRLAQALREILRNAAFVRTRQLRPDITRSADRLGRPSLDFLVLEIATRSC